MTTHSRTFEQPSVKPADLTLDLLTQLTARPSFREVASVLLRQTLQEQYPALDINPDLSLVGSPSWEIVEDKIVPGLTFYQTLSDILARQSVVGGTTTYIEGEHFLTQQPLTDPPMLLPVRIVDIAHTLNTLAPVMPAAFQEQQVEFWNHSTDDGPRWHGFSNSLRAAWNVQRVDGWDDDDCAMARLLFHAPARSGRLNDPYNLRACLIDIDQVDDAKVTHLNECSTAVLIGRRDEREIILTYSLLKGYEKFASLEQLGQSLPDRLSPSATRKKIQWRLFEPTGDFFDHQACSLIALQIEAIGTQDFSIDDEPETAPALVTPEQIAKNGPPLDWYRQVLPDWLRQASLSDLGFYSRHLKDLAALQSMNLGKSYQDDIPPIEQYALEALKAEMLKEHPEALHLPLDKLSIRVQSLVVWGTFTVPGQTDTTTFSLSELALQNLIAVPLGNKTLLQSNERPLPQWMTVDYVESLVSKADIGKQYPALINSKLLEIKSEASRRKRLYAHHLRIQLPLLALQCKIRREHGIDEQGYRYVAAAMQADTRDRKVDGQDIVIRPLAFVPQRRSDGSRDEVENMYVIGAKGSSAGPCLLYRPQFDPALIQYPSHANLMYAIAQSPDLRKSVLAWLPDAVRNHYANYVFPGALPSPWAVADFLVDTSTQWTMSGPISLGERTLDGDLFASLYEANAHALIKLADRQSVSNAENRWETLKHAGWTLLNAALPFASPTVATGAWIWQVVEQVQQFVIAWEDGAKPAQWAALTDVLLNLATAITLHISTRLRPAGRRREPEPTLIKPAPLPTVETLQLETIATHELPAGHARWLHTSGAVNRAPATLGRVLDSFKVSKPHEPSTVETNQGPHQHLTRHDQKYYAQVGERWFEVAVDENDTVMIIDPQQPERTGPTLFHSAAGQWVIDTRLRLRGGGPKQMLKLAKAEATLQAAEVRDKLVAFENAKKTAQSELQQTHRAMTEAPGTSAAAKRELYLQKLGTQSADYETALQQLKRLNVFTSVPDYQQKALGYVRAQLELNEAGIREAQTLFTPKLKTTLDQIERQSRESGQREVAGAQEMTDLSEDMIARLDYTQTRFAQLRSLALDGQRLIQDARKRLPAYTSTDLKALQVTLARNLCLEKASAATEPDAWKVMDEIVDSADLSVQALCDTLHERSESRLDERIDSLGSLIEQFKVIDERLEDFPQEFPALVLSDPLQGLRLKLREFSQEALHHLSLLHVERDAFRNRPTPPPTPPRPLKKFIHTRYNGVLIGEPRLTPIGLETNLVDIKSPLTQQVIATFHEKSPNVWLQRVTTSQGEDVVPDIQVSLDHGQALLDGLTAFKRRAVEQKNKPDRTAVGIEYLYHRHALLLEETNRHIERALAHNTVTEIHSNSAASIGKQLHEAARELYKLASSHMMQMIKQRAPTTTGIEWLRDRNAVIIKKVIKRRRLTNTVPDYLDEYTISERYSHEVLWYAHFHYSAAWTPDKSFISARLKTLQEYQKGSSADSIQGLTEQQQIAYFRSEISLEAAKRLFFDH
ncbi:dermonecrotic toxin domain-containing protein [Pseudomonas sp. R3-18-08]|uniref:dermonecrotic toxin domain-containing protein n=1 Tax=Pseudomonas sp. R3-18-08 TaxID=1173283 RepID=UPI000F6C2A89|nr:DUF6543 domain-containing protein [Pseudomonas sp. R3-18-08]AZF18719.1 hypothetical protein C4J92_5282 [Pseudomonas sp. R3-18-08]